MALNTLHKVVGQDAQAVQRHRNTIVDCLKDNDSSIRQRALELVYALVNEANVKVLVKELLSYLMACDVEFKDELTQRICHVVEKYATDKEWHVDTIIQTLLVSTSFTSEETVCSMIALITSNPDLQAYATHKLYATLAASTTQPVLLQLAVWCVGEYGELLVSSPSPDGGGQPDPKTVVELLAGVLRSPIADMVTKEYTINALMKLTSRFAAGSPAHALIHKQLAQYSTSMSLELQQRSVEYASLLKLDSIASGVLERMPAFTKKERNPSSAVSDEASGNSAASSAPVGMPAAAAAPATPAPPAATPEVDLLADLMGGSPAPAPVATSAMPAAPPPGVGGGMDDLLGLIGSPAPAPAPPAAAGVDAMTAMMGGGAMSMGGTPPGAFPPFQAWNKNGLLVMFACSKDPANASITNIDASFTNSSGAQMDQLNFQVAVPKYMQLKMTPPNSTTVPPNNSGTVKQTFKVANSMHGQKPVLLRIKVEYSTMGQPVSETGQVCACSRPAKCLPLLPRMAVRAMCILRTPCGLNQVHMLIALASRTVPLLCRWITSQLVSELLRGQAV